MWWSWEQQPGHRRDVLASAGWVESGAPPKGEISDGHRRTAHDVAQISAVLFTLGGDGEASPNCFSAMYILREFEVPATAAQSPWIIPATLTLNKAL